MRERNSADIFLSLLAVVCDALAAFGGFMLAKWLRFSSGWFDAGWFAIRNPPGANFHEHYTTFGLALMAVALLVAQNQGLFVRPQTGTFINKIPRIVKAGALTMLFGAVIAFALQNEIDISRPAFGLACATVPALLLLERYILFRIEWNLARHSRGRNHVLILGTDDVAARLKRTFAREHMLRARVVGFLRNDAAPPAAGIAPNEILGDTAELETILARQPVDQVILTNSGLGTDRMLDIMLLCEQRLAVFNVVPDLFHLMTTSMDVQSLDDIPLLGTSPWPLDHFRNRLLKRLEDLVGAAIGLLLAAPIMAWAAMRIRRSSPGPVFYAQERCGEKGQSFTIYKLRTMAVDAEKLSGPVFASVEDTRRTPIGAFLRAHNLDELPQLWNVLKGEMSLVGPRPERPHFVEQFKTEVARYMWRHTSKPGMTGWAQVNGLRGDTSIAERVKYDLYYLENWSLAFDFKILLKTLFAHKNAY